MPVSDTYFWFGTPASLQDYLEQSKVKMQVMAGTPSLSSDTPNSRLLDIVGNIGLISVKGPLVNGDSWWATTYGEVRNAVIEAATNSEVAHIVLDIDSGGGSASGVSETAQLIRLVHDTMKPVTAYAGGLAASAAYWLAASAGKVYAADTAITGSIGVITTHFDVSKALKEDGVTATVFRAGEFKALASPYEPLSPKATQQIEGQLASLYGVFTSAIASYRGVSPDFVVKHMAEGREFVGVDAMPVKLIDGVTTIDALVGGLQTQINNSSANQRHSFSMEIPDMAKRRVLSPEAVAAMAEGAPLDAVLSTTPEEPDTGGGTADAAAEPTTPEPEVTEPAATTSAAPDLVTFLQTQLAAAQGEVIELKVANGEQKRRLESMESSFEALKEIACGSINKMRIAMKGAAMDLSGLPAETVLDMHSKTTKEFQATFPVGGKTALPDTKDPGADASINPMAGPQLRAVKFK